jgi:hypothetical protein
MIGTTSAGSGEAFTERDADSRGRRGFAGMVNLLRLKGAGCAFGGRFALTSAVHLNKDTYAVKTRMFLLTLPQDSRRTPYVPRYLRIVDCASSTFHRRSSELVSV